MNFGSPLTKHQKKPKEVKEKVVKIKRRIKASGAKSLVASKTALNSFQCDWVERWLDHFVREKSLPPQIVGGDPLSTLSQYLSPEAVLSVLKEVREQFYSSFPATIRKEDFSFLTQENIKDGRSEDNDDSLE